MLEHPLIFYENHSRTRESSKRFRESQVVKITLKTVDEVLNKVFEIDSPLTDPQRIFILPSLNVAQFSLESASQASSLVAAFREHNLPTDIVAQPSNISTVLETEGEPKLYIAQETFLPMISLDQHQPKNKEDISRYALQLFGIIASHALGQIPPQIEIQDQPRIVAAMPGAIISFLTQGAENQPQKEQILKFIQELESSFSNLNALKLIGRGIQIGFKDPSGRIFYFFYPLRNRLSGLLVDYAQKDFDIRIGQGHWFKIPEDLPSGDDIDVEVENYMQTIHKRAGINPQDPQAIYQSYRTSELSGVTAQIAFEQLVAQEIEQPEFADSQEPEDESLPPLSTVAQRLAERWLKGEEGIPPRKIARKPRLNTAES